MMTTESSMHPHHHEVSFSFFSFTKTFNCTNSFLTIYFCLHLCVCVCVYQYLWKPEEGIRSPVTGVIGGCESLDRMLGTQPRFSGRAAAALNHRAICLALVINFKPETLLP